MYSRNAQIQLRAALADTPVVLIHGARQTGKSTLARGLIPPRPYLTLDESTTLAAAMGDPSGFIAGLREPVILDEVQRAPAIFLAIKASVDKDRRPGRFLLTGSANVLLVPKVSESLAGRIEIVTLWPLSQGEIEGRAERFVDGIFASKLPMGVDLTERGGPLVDRVLRGGYPEPLGRGGEDRRAAWYAAYISSILQRDVRDLADVGGITVFPRLLSLLATRTSGLLNSADLSRGLSIPQTTIRRYLALLEATFMVVSIPAWSKNHGLRLTKAPKIMLADTGLTCHLLGMSRARIKIDDNARGALVESFVAMELLKQIGWSKIKPKLHHFRTVAGKEVDLVLEDAAGRVVGIEIKSAASVSANDFGGLRVLAEAAGSGFVRGIVLYDGEQVVSFGKSLAAIPISALWRW